MAIWALGYTAVRWPLPSLIACTVPLRIVCEESQHGRRLFVRHIGSVQFSRKLCTSPYGHFPLRCPVVNLVAKNYQRHLYFSLARLIFALNAEFPYRQFVLPILIPRVNWKPVGAGRRQVADRGPLICHSPDSSLPPTSVDDDADGISEHRLVPYNSPLS